MTSEAAILLVVLIQAAADSNIDCIVLAAALPLQIRDVHVLAEDGNTQICHTCAECVTYLQGCYNEVCVCVFRPVEDSSQPPGRGVLSMQGLSYGVVRVDTEERLSVLTVQDVGTVTPGGTTQID